MKYLLPLLLLCACRTTSESESRVHATTAETLDTTGETDTHIVDAPDRTTTTVEEFEAPPVNSGPAAAVAPMGSEAPPRQVPDHGPLVKRTVIVEEHGQVVTDTVADLKSQQREDTELTGSAQQKSTFDLMHNPLMWIGAAVLLVVVLGTILYVAIKLRKAVPIP